MAITANDYTILLSAAAQGFFPQKPNVLELGESNWYSDVPLQQFADDIQRHVKNEALRAALTGEMKQIVEKGQNNPPPHEYQAMCFTLAKMFYRMVFDYASIEAIDLDSTSPTALRLDLNHPVDRGKRYDIVLNVGTGEHVFNVYQFFKNVHDLTAPGGVMYHEMPFTGWYDHGFFSFQPTFYFDLAAANGYSLHFINCAQILPLHSMQFRSREEVAQAIQKGLPQNTLMAALLKKSTEETAFKIPTQGVYAGNLSQESQHAWLNAR